MNSIPTSVLTARAPTGLIGVVHLPPMPGDPRHRGAGGFAEVERLAMADAEALVAGGVDAIIIENFGSSPFPKGTIGDRLPPHQTALLALLARQMLALSVPIGLNCLRNDAISALGAAAASGASFVRVNVHTGAYVTDQGLIEGEAAQSLRYRAALGATNVAIAADVLVKHASPLAPLDPTTATHDCLDRGLADAVIVTGAATGAPVDRELLAQVREAAGDAVVLVGSGMTPERAPELGPLIDGAIVGTWVKRGGDVRAPVEIERVRRMGEALRPRLRVRKEH